MHLVKSQINELIKEKLGLKTEVKKDEFKMVIK